MKFRVIGGIILANALSLFAVTAEAVPIVLDSSVQCSVGTAVNGITVSDVTGNNGGASDCWGTYDGNDPGPGGSFTIGSTVFDFIAKEDMGTGLEGADIGLSVLPSGGAPSGTWEYDPTKFSADQFLIVLKAANSPGYAAWLFAGTDAASFKGDWLVAWDKDLSHLAIYASGASVPAPLTLGLMGLGLVAFGVQRRLRKRA